MSDTKHICLRIISVDETRDGGNMRRFAIAIVLISVNFGECFILMDVINAKRQIVFPLYFREQFGNLSVQFERSSNDDNR